MPPLEHRRPDSRRPPQGLLPHAAQAPLAGVRPVPRRGAHGGHLFVRADADLSGHRDGADRAGAAQGSQHPGSLADRLAHPGLLPHAVRDHDEPADHREGHRDAEPPQADAGARPGGRSGPRVPGQRHGGAQAQHPARARALRQPRPRAGRRGGQRPGPPVRQAQSRHQAEGRPGGPGLAHRADEYAARQGAGILGGAAELSGEGRDHGAAGAAPDHRPEDHGLQQAVSGIAGPAALGRVQDDRAAAHRQRSRRRPDDLHGGRQPAASSGSSRRPPSSTPRRPSCPRPTRTSTPRFSRSTRRSSR